VRQAGDGPVVDVGPRFASGAVVERDLQHLPEIFGRLRKALAQASYMSNSPSSGIAIAQRVQFAEHDFLGIVRSSSPG